MHNTHLIVEQHTQHFWLYALKRSDGQTLGSIQKRTNGKWTMNYVFGGKRDTITLENLADIKKYAGALYGMPVAD